MKFTGLQKLNMTIKECDNPLSGNIIRFFIAHALFFHFMLFYFPQLFSVVCRITWANLYCSIIHVRHSPKIKSIKLEKMAVTGQCYEKHVIAKLQEFRIFETFRQNKKCSLTFSHVCIWADIYVLL